MMTGVLYIFLTFVFWSSLALIGFSYAVYPTLLKILARGKKLPDDCFESDSELPEVAVLMAVYNEESVIEETLQSILGSDYPAEKIRVLIGSDGSTDQSHEIIGKFQADHPELSLVIFSGRNGKIRIINQLATDAAKLFSNHETAALVLCDANVVWSKGALRNMVRHLKREDVGLIGSCVMDQNRDHDGIGHEEEAYVGRENRTKYFEGVLWGNMMGAFGACYAMRAKLFTPVPEAYIVDDFFQTMACLEGGSKAIVDLDAEVYEAVSVEIDEEFRRKTRIATGNFQNLSHFLKFLMPWNAGLRTFFAFWSHKGMRWIGPHLLVFVLVSIVALSVMNSFYLLPLSVILLSFAVAGLDWFMVRRGTAHVKLFRFVRYFYAMNGAVWLGWVAFQRGVRNSVWEPTKRIAKDESNKPAEAALKS